MQLTIFAATGGIGRQALEQALAAGHDVTAVARHPQNLAGATRIVTADLASSGPGVVVSAVRGADAVLSCLGPRSKSDAGIASKGTAAIIAAMQSAGVRRIVVVSAAPVATVALPGRPVPPKHDPGDGFFMRYLLGPAIRTALKSVYVDLAIMELGTNVRGGVVVSRADVAHLMLAVLNQPETIGRTIGIAN
jgi:NAD(P)-dependent dehydrogenase (short-subunit alcohol dehydrogenase family)